MRRSAVSTTSTARSRQIMLDPTTEDAEADSTNTIQRTVLRPVSANIVCKNELETKKIIPHFQT